MKFPFTDPVCGMRIETDTFAVEHGGQRYAFCSTHCQQKFVADPAHYIRSAQLSTNEPSKHGCCR